MSRKSSKISSVKYKYNDLDMVAYPGDDDYEIVLGMQERGEKMEIKTREDGLDSAIEKAKSAIDAFPLPSKPSTFGKPYTFPEDITQITSTDLGQWLFKMAGYKGYALRMLAYVETEDSILKDAYSAKISKEMAKIEAKKKMNKESMVGVILTESEEVSSLKAKMIKKSADVIGCKRIVEMYTMQLEVISREISRRSNEMKLAPRGILTE